MVAVAVAQDEPVEPLGLEPEKVEISHQNLGRVTEIEKILARLTRTVGFEMQRQPPFTGQGRIQVAANSADMLYLNHRVRRLRHELVENRVDDANHDEFWAYRRSLLAFIGQGAGDALDVGCGEGRVSRVLKECGYRVTAIDPVERLISAAEQAGSADAYRIAAAADLPFENCSFDLAVAYNVLMDIEDVPGALNEIRRVLRPSGTLVISIVHPFADRGHFAGPEGDAPFVVQESYFSRERFEATEVRNGLKMHFVGWSQPLESYMAALENAGLAITSLREPIPDTVDNGSHIERWKKIPLFLWLKAIPLPSSKTSSRRAPTI
jgi:SAM-dependent methyltransferase